MAAAHEQWRIEQVVVKAYNDLVELKELAGEAIEQDVMDKVYKAWARIYVQLADQTCQLYLRLFHYTIFRQAQTGNATLATLKHHFATSLERFCSATDGMLTFGPRR